MKTLEKVSDFVGKYMAGIVIVVAALALFFPGTFSVVKTAWVNSRSRLLGRRCRPFSRKARRGSSHGHPALPCTIRQLSAAFFPGTLSRHSRIFHCPGVYSPARGKSSDAARRIFHLVFLRSESISDKGSAGVCGRRSCGKAEEAALSAQRTSDIPESSVLRPISQLFLPKSG